MTPQNALADTASRDLAIDRLRGILVILMAAGDYIAGIGWIPPFLKHAPDIGFTVADTVAPIFVFIIGLTYGMSFRRRAAENRLSAFRHFFQRYLALIGIGACISAASTLFDQPSNWGVLQSLGVAGLVTLAFIQLPAAVRFAAGLMMLVGYQFMLDSTMLEAVLSSGHGGLFGAISWSALLLLSTAIADFWSTGCRAQLISNTVVITLAFSATLIIPVSKNRVSMSYILLSLAISALTFLIIRFITDRLPKREGVLAWWGKHALAMYMAHLVALAPFSLVTADWWYRDAPLWLVVLQLITILCGLTLFARRLERSGAKTF